MAKLKLDLTELAVESFDTDAVPEVRGTVLGNSSWECAGTYGGDSCDSTCRQFQCGCTIGLQTCDYSCAGTCGVIETCVQGCEFYTEPPACPTSSGYAGC